MKEETKSQNYLDVTNEWLKTSNPNSHRIKNLNYWIINNKKYYVDNKYIILDYSKSELECALWLEKTFGGEIYMCPKVNKPDGIKTPDYLFRNEYWDLKEIKGNGKNTIDSIIKKSKNQTINYIIDIAKTTSKLTK